MTIPEITALIDKHIESAAIIREAYGARNVEFDIDDVHPDDLIQLSEQYNQKWFRCADQMAVMLLNIQAGYRIILHSTPVKIKEIFEYIK